MYSAHAGAQLGIGDIRRPLPEPTGAASPRSAQTAAIRRTLREHLHTLEGRPGSPELVDVGVVPM